MRAKLELLTTLCCAFALALALVGCSGVDRGLYAGEWTLSSGSSDEVSAAAVKDLRESGRAATLVLEEDGTGTLDLFGEARSVTWEAESNNAGSISIGDSGVATLKLANSQLSIVNGDGESMTFERAGS